MKLTAILNKDGKLAGLVHAHLSENDRSKADGSGPFATLRPHDGQLFYEIEVPAEFEKLSTPELMGRILAYLPGEEKCRPVDSGGGAQMS